MGYVVGLHGTSVSLMSEYLRICQIWKQTCEYWLINMSVNFMRISNHNSPAKMFFRWVKLRRWHNKNPVECVFHQKRRKMIQLRMGQRWEWAKKDFSTQDRTLFLRCDWRGLQHISPFCIFVLLFLFEGKCWWQMHQSNSFASVADVANYNEE